MTEPVPFKYRAFISYSHADTAHAKWLHRGLETFRIDKDLAGRDTAFGPVPKSLKPVFRDREDFTAGHSLTEQTLAALDQSAALVVICSPASAKSQYVNEEIRLFKSRHPERPVVPLIAGGKPGDAELECFPPALQFKVDAKGRIGKKRVELLAADLREEGDGKPLALAKVVAALLGVSSDEVFRRAERERRRKARLRNGVVAVLALLALVASGSAVYAWQQLKTNEAFLDATLKTATEIVDQAVSQAEQYGMPRRATLALLTRAEALFDNMALLGRPTPELRHRKAWMMIQFASNYRVLGDTGKWGAASKEAVGLLHGLYQEFPDNAVYIRDFAIAAQQVADLSVSLGDLQPALRVYRDILQLTEHLSASNPDDLGLQHSVSIAKAKVGDVLAKTGDVDGALAAYRESLAIGKRLAAAQPESTAIERSVFVSQKNVGDMLRALGKSGEALAAYREAEAIAARRLGNDAKSLQAQRDLSVARNMIGMVLATQGQREEALEAFRGALDIRRRLAEADPENASAQYDLAVSLERTGDAELAQASPAAALPAFDESLAIFSRLAQADPDNAEWQRALALAHNKVGDVRAALGQEAEAERAYRASLAITRRLAEADTSNAMWQRDLAVALNRLGALLAAQKKLDDALAQFEAGRSVMETLAAADPGNAEWQRDLSIGYQKIGETLSAQGHAAQALEPLRRSLAIRTRLAEAAQDDRRLKLDLAVAHIRLGEALITQDAEAALRSMEDGLAIRRALLAGRPDDALAAWDIAITLNQIGLVRGAIDDKQGALGAFREARDIVLQLKPRFPDNAKLPEDVTRLEGEIAKLEDAGAEGTVGQGAAAAGAQGPSPNSSPGPSQP